MAVDKFWYWFHDFDCVREEFINLISQIDVNIVFEWGCTTVVNMHPEGANVSKIELEGATYESTRGFVHKT